MKKIIALTLILSALLGLTACNRFEDTPETEAAFDAYEAAVMQSIAHKKGAITVVTENVDTIIDKKTTIGVIEYQFITDENGKVTFQRDDFTDETPVASYKGDGEKAYQLDFASGEWEDVTEESAEMLNHQTNYMNTLSLFRIDNQFRYSKRFYESVVMEEKEGEKIITFTLKNDTVSEILSYTDKREIKRNLSSQYRSYYVNEKGDLYKIVIDTVQEVNYKGEDGRLSTLLTVNIDY